MKKTGTMTIVAIFIAVCGIVIPGTAFTASLDQYLCVNLGGNLGNPGGFSCDVASSNLTADSSTLRPASRNSGFSMGKLHKYTGYATIAAAATAAVSGSDDGFHKGAGDATAALALATCITGFTEFGHYFDMDEGLSVYNIHIILATLATAGFVATVVDANSKDDDDDNKSGHAGLGIGSTVLMAVPVVILHF